jgi:hypothetical protein
VKTLAIVGIIASILALATAATTATLSHMVYAKKPNDPDLFGKSASDLAKNDDNPDTKASGMGDHSKEGSVAGDAPFDKNPITDEPDKPGRSGIGNIGNDLGITCGSKHPSDLANILTGGTCEEP